MKNGGYPPGVDYGDTFAPWNGDYPDDEPDSELEHEEEGEDETNV